MAALVGALLPVVAGPRAAVARTVAPPADPPAWALEVPGAAGAHWGLGLDRFTSGIDHVRGRGVLRRTTVIQGDPVQGADSDLGLDLDLDLDLVGVQVPISLGSFRLGLGRAYLFAVLEAGKANPSVTTRFASDQVPGGNQDGALYVVQTSNPELHGDGSYYGASLGLAAALGARRGWFVEGRVRFMDAPSVTVDNSISAVRAFLGGPWPVVDGVQAAPRTGGELGSRRWIATARLGRALFGGRVAPYLGIRRGSSDVDLTTNTTVPGLFDAPTVIETEHHLQTDTVDGVAGIDARFGRHLYARTEGTFGDEQGLLLKVVRLFGGAERPEPPEPTEPPGGDTSGLSGHDVPPERARALARRLAPRLRQVLDALQARRSSLDVVPGPGGVPSYRRGDLASFLVEAEARLTRALVETGGATELAPLQDYFERRADRVREELGCAGGAAGAAAARRPGLVGPADRSRAVPAARGILPAQEPAAGETVPKAQADGPLDAFFSALRDVFTRAKEDRLLVALCVRVRPVTATLELCPFLGSEGCRTDTVRGALLLHRYLGLYAFHVEGADGSGPVGCEPATGADDPPCPLDLVDDPKPIFDCDLAQGNCARLGGHAEPCS